LDLGGGGAKIKVNSLYLDRRKCNKSRKGCLKEKLKIEKRIIGKIRFFTQKATETNILHSHFDFYQILNNKYFSMPFIGNFETNLI
jgi:hypothetical protein